MERQPEMMELIKYGEEILHKKFYKLIVDIWRKEQDQFSKEWNNSRILYRSLGNC